MFFFFLHIAVDKNAIFLYSSHRALSLKAREETFAHKGQYKYFSLHRKCFPVATKINKQKIKLKNKQNAHRVGIEEQARIEGIA